MIDIHSHLLPGIDDGSKSFNDSIAILQGLSEQGITDVIITPHYVNGSTYMNPVDANRELLHTLRYEVISAGIPIRTYLGNEIYIDRDIVKLIKKDKITPLANSHYLLVELPMSGDFPDYEDILASLQYAGYRVILAHPERYHTIHADYSIVERLHEQGVLFQCNLGSFIGQYGRHAQKTVKRIAKDKFIFAVGTDIHHQRDYSEIAHAKKKLAHFYKKDELHRILVDNPASIILDGKTIKK